MTWFIDGGAHRGESIRLARKLYPAPLSVLAIEPASECWDDLAAEGVLVMPAALWVSMGYAPFYRGEYEVSATLIAEKTTGGLSTAAPERVPTITLGSILRALPAGDPVVVKLDIEGAEYDVLEQALADGTLDERVRQLYVDFHGDRIAGFPAARHNELVRALLRRGHDLPKWIPGEGRVVEWGSKWLMEER